MFIFFIMLDFPPEEMMSIKPVKALIRKYLAFADQFVSMAI